MTVLIEIPLNFYQAFLGRCIDPSREYEVLRNALIDHVPKDLRDGNAAAILCSAAEAELLLDRAKRFYPAVTPYIDAALRSSEFRKPDSGITWHSSAYCALWPTSDFVLSKNRPRGAELRDECVVKEPTATARIADTACGNRDERQLYT